MYTFTLHCPHPSSQDKSCPQNHRSPGAGYIQCSTEEKFEAIKNFLTLNGLVVNDGKTVIT